MVSAIKETIEDLVFEILLIILFREDPVLIKKLMKQNVLVYLIKY